jgi:hypothetical protein
MRDYYGNYIRNVFPPQLQQLAEHGIAKAIVPFERPADEANAHAEAEYARMAALPGDADLGEIAEIASDAGSEYYGVLKSVEQAMTNLLAAGIYHLFEQQSKQVIELAHVAGLSAPVLSEFPTYPKVYEARLVANVVKHAEGDSAERLRHVRPDLFTGSPFGAALQRIRPLPVRAPLAGDSLYVMAADITAYANAGAELWLDVADRYFSEATLR